MTQAIPAPRFGKAAPTTVRPTEKVYEASPSLMSRAAQRGAAIMKRAGRYVYDQPSHDRPFGSGIDGALSRGHHPYF